MLPPQSTMCAAMRRSSRVLLVLAATTSALAPLPSRARRGPPPRAAAPLKPSGGAAVPAEAPRRLLVMLSLGYGGSMFAFRPTLMIVLPALLKSLHLSEADGGALLSTCQPGQDKRANFPTSKAPISAISHSFRLTFGRAIISRNGLEAWMVFPERARAEHSR